MCVLIWWFLIKCYDLFYVIVSLISDLLCDVWVIIVIRVKQFLTKNTLPVDKDDQLFFLRLSSVS